jgi:hypothetical protein
MRVQLHYLKLSETKFDWGYKVVAVRREGGILVGLDLALERRH